jgi:hypothetical protein
MALFQSQSLMSQETSASGAVTIEWDYQEPEILYDNAFSRQGEALLALTPKEWRATQYPIKTNEGKLDKREEIYLKRAREICECKGYDDVNKGYRGSYQVRDLEEDERLVIMKKEGTSCVTIKLREPEELRESDNLIRIADFSRLRDRFKLWLNGHLKTLRSGHLMEPPKVFDIILCR